MFIAQEEGAVRLADAEVTDGTDVDAVRFARADHDQHAPLWPACEPSWQASTHRRAGRRTGGPGTHLVALLILCG